MENFLTNLEQITGPQMAAIGVLMLFVWFLPALLALFLNRKHFKLILLACVPAGLSLIAWSGVMVWAVTGKVVDKYRNKTLATQDNA